jgi:hypothetical protein
MAVYLVGRGIEYIREGIDDVGDIYEVFDGPAPPGGPGYALADIVKVEILTLEEVNAILDAKRPVVKVDPTTDKEYWENPDDSKYYEVKIHPKYDLNFSDFTLQDRAILSSDKATSLQQVSALGKIRTNIRQYPENTQTLAPPSLQVAREG